MTLNKSRTSSEEAKDFKEAKYYGMEFDRQYRITVTIFSGNMSLSYD